VRKSVGFRLDLGLAGPPGRQGDKEGKVTREGSTRKGLSAMSLTGGHPGHKGRGGRDNKG